MGAIRTFLAHRRRLAGALFVLALALRALVPAGMMVEGHGRTLSVAICADASGLAKVHTLAIADAAPGKGKGSGATHDGEAGACPYAGLAMAALGAADPVLLALALALVMALALRRPPPPAPSAAHRLRPPLRAPPVFA